MKPCSLYYQKLFLSIIFGFITIQNSNAFFASECGGPVFQVGWYTATQGKSQHINIEGLIGDDFSVKKSSDQNVLIGLGYYFKGPNLAQTSLLYGVNAFYFAPIKVKGDVTQEDLFTNLSYHYSRTNYPIYLAAKALIHCTCNTSITLDLGVGPNFAYTHGFKEHSLDGGITIPDPNIFAGKTKAVFSATAGLGWRINNLIRNFSFEIDYRFFYLGKGELKKNNSQLRNTLRTGNSYANALFVSFSI